MIVFSNRRLGASAEVLVSRAVAIAMLRETAVAATPSATSRWEQELVRWLIEKAQQLPAELDVGELAWTRDHFESQRSFLIAAIAHAANVSEHGPALTRWRKMIESHPAESVQFGRRWSWASPITTA